ncbi:MAG: translocation/assembly module TamB domain-containing protein, partial [Ferruginibacter sp.]
DQANQFSINGVLNFSDTATETLAMNMEAKSVRLDILEPYLEGVFSQIKGVASGQLRYVQPQNEPAALIGKMILDSTLLKVDYTQVAYRVNKQPIILEKDRILLQSMQLKDSLQNSMSLNGSIRHQGFHSIFLDNIKIESSKIALLNTNRTDNPYFWGNITGQVQTTIHGPVNDINIDIKGEPNRVDTSQIYLNTDYSGESRSFDYIYFKTADDKTLNIPKQTSSNNISVSLNISANPACKVDVILDEETKDIIKGTGTGEIKINTGSSKPLTISGIYNLTKGEYTFNFQTFFKKPFTLLQGGVIRWDKNPYDAFIDMKAEYVAGGVDISSLSTSSGLNRREDIRIISSLRGSLKNPEIHFTFELPDKSENRRDDVLVKRLADFQNDENEMNKQVASLLLFNTFILGDQNLFTQGTASNLITRSIGGMMSNLLTGFLNRELKKATNGILSTYIDISPTLDLQRNVSQVQANVKAGLKILLSNRLEVLVGGQLDYNNPALAQYLDRRGLITPDINVEWIINRDGSLRVIGFNRSSIDISMNQRNRSGLQLSYRKETNRFSDIFRRRKKGDQD